MSFTVGKLENLLRDLKRKSDQNGEKDMTQREYFERIGAIRGHIGKGKLEKAEELLTQLYAYKPVRLLWFVAKAEYVLKKYGDLKAALKILDDKYFLGEDYPGLKECMEFRINAFRQKGEEWDAIREEYCYRKACGQACDHLEEALVEGLELLAEDSENLAALETLGEKFYHTADIIAYLIVRMAQMQMGNVQEDAKVRWFDQIPNCGYLKEKLCSKKANTFILVMDESLNRALEILGFLLHKLGHQVFLLSPPQVFETENRLDLRETIEVSMEHIQRYPDMCVIPPVALTQGGEVYGDNREYIIDHICREESQRDNAVVLCSGYLLEQLCIREGIRGRIGRLSPYETDFKEEKLQFGWAGSYLSYISDLYGYDVRADLEAKPEVDFSILIPARNSSKTLRHTLETCLKQRYQGSYEVVISDNSVDGDSGIYDLCQELGDSRIRYVRTPRSLTLTKSFEFGYLQTRGEFVLSMGSDDGLLPWGLEVIKQVMDRFPQEEIIQWDRGFYAWPGFNGGQENMFQIPRKYEKQRIQAYLEDTGNILKSVAQNPQMVYIMPLLYINSGFRRRYLKTLMEKTGKLFDGCNQDLQTGMINCCINKRILQIYYPITIAGMSDTSVGYLVGGVTPGAEGEKTAQARKQIYQWENMGLFIPLKRERLMYGLGIDIGSLYRVLSRAVEEGLIPEKEADQVLSWQTVVLHGAESYHVLLRDTCDLFIHVERFMAKKLGKEQVRWFEREVYGKALALRCVYEGELERSKAQKSYREEVDQFGGEVLDASRYGVSNIGEAVELFEKKTGL